VAALGLVTMHAQRALAALLMITTIGMSTSSVGKAPSPALDSASSLIGTWRLVLADDRADKTSPWVHSYGEHPRGYLVYDQTGHVFIQFSNDPPTPPFAAGDDFKPTAREVEMAYVNYTAYFGTYSVDQVRHVITHHVEGSLQPSYTSTDQERPYTLVGDRLELSDGKTWRRVWVRVPPPNYAFERTVNDQVPSSGMRRAAAQRER
jgi:Lipocalin-like domain